MFSRFGNLVNRVLQTGVHILRKKFKKNVKLYIYTIKFNLFRTVFSTDYSEIWPQGGKFMSHVIIGSVLALVPPPGARC